MEIKLVQFQQHGDERGHLVAVEEGKEIPFSIKRVYYIYDTAKNVRRGYHAHKTLHQVLFCVNGACTLHLDNGEECAEVRLDKPYEGLYIDNLTWREMYDFTDGAVLMVLASELYNEEDYIRNYQEFIDYVREVRK